MAPHSLLDRIHAFLWHSQPSPKLLKIPPALANWALSCSLTSHSCLCLCVSTWTVFLVFSVTAFAPPFLVSLPVEILAQAGPSRLSSGVDPSTKLSLITPARSTSSSPLCSLRPGFCFYHCFSTFYPAALVCVLMSVLSPTRGCEGQKIKPLVWLIFVLRSIRQ